MINKPTSEALEEAVRVLRALAARPECGWQSRRAGVFTLFFWPEHDVARWLGEPTSIRRAFRGLDAPDLCDRIAIALRRVEVLMSQFGMCSSGQREIPVFLWDADLNLPNQLIVRDGRAQVQNAARQPQRLETPTALSFPDGSGAAVLLPSAARVRNREHAAEWLEASTVHEGFHALLREWLGITRVKLLFRRKAWTKIEEMCAVWLETLVYPANRSHLDYGRSWLATLMLSHVYESGSHDADFEYYSHYVLLTSLERLLGEPLDQDHWLPKFWKQARQATGADLPWPLLDDVAAACGGLGAAFERAVGDTVLRPAENTVVCQIVDEFETPAATILETGRMIEPIWLPPLSAHIFQGEQSGSSGDIEVRLQGAPEDLGQMRVRTMAVNSGEAKGLVQVPLIPSSLETNVCFGRINPAADGQNTIVVCHTGITGGAVQVQVKWREQGEGVERGAVPNGT